MSGVVRAGALALFVIAVAGCQTDGLVAPEAGLTAKPRVVDTRKSGPKTATAKKDSGKATAFAQGDTSDQPTPTREEATGSIRPTQVAATAPSRDANVIPAQSLFGNWTLVEDGGRKCRIILGGVPLGTSYSARGEASCSDAFAGVQSWEIQGDQLVLRNHERRVVGRLAPTGPFRFDGRAESGPAVYLIR